jgi:hypothetical protein
MAVTGGHVVPPGGRLDPRRRRRRPGRAAGLHVGVGHRLTTRLTDALLVLSLSSLLAASAEFWFVRFGSRGGREKVKKKNWGVDAAMTTGDSALEEVLTGGL